MEENKIIIIILLLTLITRTPYLQEEMRQDEAYSYMMYTRQGVKRVLTTYDLPNNHILHNLLVIITTKIYGNNETQIRLIAYISGILIPITAYLIFKKYHSKNAAITSAILLITNLCLANHTVNARGYTLETLLFIIAYDYYKQKKPVKTGILILLTIMAVPLASIINPAIIKIWGGHFNQLSFNNRLLTPIYPFIFLMTGKLLFESKKGENNAKRLSKIVIGISILIICAGDIRYMINPAEFKTATSIVKNYKQAVDFIIEQPGEKGIIFRNSEEPIFVYYYNQKGGKIEDIQWNENKTHKYIITNPETTPAMALRANLIIDDPSTYKTVKEWDNIKIHYKKEKTK